MVKFAGRNQCSKRLRLKIGARTKKVDRVRVTCNGATETPYPLFSRDQHARNRTGTLAAQAIQSLVCSLVRLTTSEATLETT